MLEKHVRKEVDVFWASYSLNVSGYCILYGNKEIKLGLCLFFSPKKHPLMMKLQTALGVFASL